jgi:hypothetical protein
MEIVSQKPKEWVGITNEPNYRFTSAHVCVLLLKGLCSPTLPTLPCPCFALFHPALPRLLCFTFTPFCFALPLTMPVLPAFGCPW